MLAVSTSHSSFSDLCLDDELEPVFKGQISLEHFMNILPRQANYANLSRAVPILHSQYFQFQAWPQEEQSYRAERVDLLVEHLTGPKN